MMRLQGRVSVITGATGGIGRAIVAAFAAEGAQLILTGRRPDPGDLPAGSRYLAGDIADESFVAQLFGDAEATFGRLDILVNCHGRQYDADVIDTPRDDARDVLDTNVLGPFLTMKHAIPLLRASGGGAIVNIASRLGIVGMAGQVLYSASKGGLIMLSKGTALEVARDGIRVNVVAPGLTATDGILAGWARKPDPEGIRRTRESTIPIGRLARPDEIAGPVVFLASDEASYVTGAVLPVDGGYTAA